MGLSMMNVSFGDKSIVALATRPLLRMTFPALKDRAKLITPLRGKKVSYEDYGVVSKVSNVG